MKNNEVLDYMESLEKEDKHLGLFVKMYEALSSFLADFDFLKDSRGLTQKDVADKMGTTQSAISRIASMKTNPSYKQLQKMAEAVGGELLITPMKDMTVQVPYDLQNTVRDLAKGENKTTNEYLDEVIRDSIQSEVKRYAKQTFEVNKVRECPYEVLRNCAENLTPEQLDYCVREYPAIALLCGAVKLTKKLKKNIATKQNNNCTVF